VVLFLPILCDFFPERDLNPFDLQDASQDAGSSESGFDDLQILAGAGPITSCSFISIFMKDYCSLGQSRHSGYSLHFFSWTNPVRLILRFRPASESTLVIP